MLRTAQFSDNALEVLRERYLWKDENGNIIETPEDMLYRVALAVGENCKEADRFYEIMRNLDFLPNSPTLMNAGRGDGYGQLSACYVVDVADSMDGIFDALKKQALIHKSGGGTGFNFSKLRGSGKLVKSTNGKASGPVSFMKLFNVATDVVQQGGMRRGANMGILNIDHPDIEKFIECKNTEGEFANFNISVGMTDEFMKNLPEDPLDDYLFNKICVSAWESGDPGLVFLDTINQDNPTPHLGRLTATNPCGETPLYDEEACNLGSINLANFVEEDTDRLFVDWNRLMEVTELAVRFLDNVIDVNEYPLPEIEKAVKKTRKIGLGVMGWAEMLFQLGIPYDSDRALALAEKVMSLITAVGKNTSTHLALEKGPYPECKPENHDGSLQRNATITCIAPTGTLSLLADCSSGIEPVFALEHKRKVFANTETGEEGQTLTFLNKYFERDREYLPMDTLFEIYVTASDISPERHVLMQSAFQAHTDLAVSKTINLPNSATVRDIANAYYLAWKTGCKGITVYRDGCKTHQVLTEITYEDDDICPDCGNQLVMKEGCMSCEQCGWSKCSV